MDSHIFQFHKGTIRTGSAPEYVAKYVTFQFHKGTIRTSNEPSSIENDGYFNSIKVQLEHRMKPNYLPTNSFQFHKGTIRTQKRNRKG